MKAGTVFAKGLWRENAVFRLVLGMCPALAVTTSAVNGLAMGLATTFVLLCSALVVSALRRMIPARVRIPAFIVIIASFVTVVDLVMEGYLFELHQALGIFIPLIVVNCLILGRTEAFFSRNSLFPSLADASGMGLGFSLALFILGAVRELLGSGTLLGVGLFGPEFTPFLLFILPPGAFIALGFLLAGMNRLDQWREGPRRGSGPAL